MTRRCVWPEAGTPADRNASLEGAGMLFLWSRQARERSVREYSGREASEAFQEAWRDAEPRLLQGQDRALEV